ncbi:MAG TPA: lactate utilization protein [Candidatus Lachnoclostridium pullistercoris]|uniref:Lactate utilization protein n=1 Tax=Candidatus Lachnoclostridium pullistercoris TaxID=2838632 RepID=A0A9D2PBS1_9FIRM|nr:lactate utilization protein [Candidatus Lachnoclostridium pullistercoris]
MRTEELEKRREMAQKIAGSLKKRNIEGFYCRDKEEALKLVLSMVPDGAKVGWGGSVTLDQIGLFDGLREKNCVMLDLKEGGKDPEETERIYRESVGADFFFMSTNGITENGELVNIDGAGTRLGRMIYGPKHVIIIAGINKISKDIESAVDRIQNEVCPILAVRSGRNTACGNLGRCGNCFTPDSMCCEIVITRKSRQNGRMKLVLVGEELGY